MADTSTAARIKRIMDAVNGEEGAGNPYIMKRDNITPEDEAACEADENCQDIETPDDAAGQQVALQKREEFNDLMKSGQTLPTEEELQNDSSVPDSVKPYLLQHINLLNSGEIDPHVDDVQDEEGLDAAELDEPGQEAPQGAEPQGEGHATMIGPGRLYGKNAGTLPQYMRNKAGNFVKPL